MKLKTRRLAAIALVVGITAGSLTTFASSTTKTLTAIMDNYKVVFDGKAQTPTNDIYLIDGSIYVGLRDMGQMTGNTVDWDGSTKTVSITSNGASDAELALKDAQIRELQIDLALAREELEMLKESDSSNGEANLDSKSVAATEDDLQSEFGREFSMRFYFDLYASKGNLYLTIEFDGDRDGSDFAALRDREIEGFLEDVCELIREYHDDVEIIGEIYDTDARETVVEFEYDTKDRLDYERYMSSSTLTGLADDIYSDYRNLETIHYDDKSINLRIDRVEVKQSRNYENITFLIGVKFSDQDTWDELVDEIGGDTSSDLYYDSNLYRLQTTLEDIAYDLEKEIGSSVRSVDGYIYNVNGISSSSDIDSGDQIVRYIDGRTSVRTH